MADGIGSLVVSIQADLARFDSDLKKATALTSQAMSKIESAAASTMRNLLAVGGAVSFGALMKSAIDAADQINRLAEQTGIAAKEIDQLSVVAKLNDIETASLVKSYKALSQAMIEGQDPTSKQSRMFEELGVEVIGADGKLRDLRAVTLDIARVFQQAKDGPEKMAVAVGLFGKAGAEMIPLLNNMAADMERAAAVQEAFGAIGEDTAKAGDALNDALTLLGEGLKRSFLPAVDALGPAMERFATAMIDLNKEGSALTPVLRILFEDILPAGVETIGALVIAANALAKSFGTLLGGIAAAVSAYFSGASMESVWQTLKDAFSDSGEFIEQSNEQISRLMNRMKEATPEIAKTSEATDKMAKAARTLTQNAGKAVDTLKAFKAAIMAVYNEAMAAAEADNALAEAEQKLREETYKSIQTEQRAIDQIRQATEGYQKQADALTLTTEELLKKERARVLELANNARAIEGGERLAQVYDEQAAAIDRLLTATSEKATKDAAAKMAEEFERQTETIAQSLTDALMRGFESGKDFADNFVDTLKNLFKTLVLRPIIQGIVQPIAQGVNSVIGGALGLSPSSAAGNLIGGAGGNILNSILPTALGSGGGFLGLGAVGATGINAIAGEGAMLAASGTLAGGAGSLAPLMAAVPWLAIGAIAIPLVMSFLNSKKGGPKSGGFATSGTVGGLTGTDSSGRWFTPSDADSVAQTLSDATLAGYNKIVKSLGGTATGGFAVGFDTDPKGTAPNRAHVGAFVNGKQVYNAALGDLGRDKEALTAALEVESKRALLAALQASDLPKQVADLLNSVTAASADTATIDAFLAVAQTLSGAPLAEAMERIKNETASTFDQFVKMAEQMRELADAYDGTSASTSALASATAQYYEAQVLLLMQIEQVRSAIEEMFGDTIRTLTLQTLDDPAKYQYLQTEADTLRDELLASSDPEQIKAIAEKINQDILAAFNLLDEEEQRARLAEYTSNIETLNAQVNERLSSIETDVQESAADVLSEIATIIAESASKQGQAADMQIDAASINLAAAQTPITVVVNGGQEVNA